MEDEKLSKHPLDIFKSQLKNNEGGDHFVHTGNLVRGEVPYKGMLREKRIDLFYILFLLAKYAKYSVCCSNVIKKGHDGELDEIISDKIYETIMEHDAYFSKFDKIIIHYDNGQDTLKGLLISSFRNKYKNVSFVKTLQGDSAFMQIADLFSYFELLKHKIKLNNLTKSEVAFFGPARKIRKNYLEQLKDKFI